MVAVGSSSNNNRVMMAVVDITLHRVCRSTSIISSNCRYRRSRCRHRCRTTEEQEV